MKRKKKFLVIAFLIGAFICINRKYDFFRTVSIEIDPPGLIPSQVLWNAMPEAAQAFWPYLLVNARSFERALESFYPVKTTIKLIGWGKYRVVADPLEIFIYVSWNSKMWLLSTDGRMWLASLPANSVVRGLQLPTRPILTWDAGLPIPIDPDDQGVDIYRSSLSMTRISKWYETIAKTSWYDDIYAMIAKKIDGRQIVQVLLSDKDRLTGEIILKDDTVNWLELAYALDAIYPNGEYKMHPGKIVNATYSDSKFVVTNKGSSY